MTPFDTNIIQIQKSFIKTKIKFDKFLIKIS
jgi:hypothetical protein